MEPHHLVDICGGFLLCMHVAATSASMADGTVAVTGSDVRCSGVEGSDDARAAVPPDKLAWSKSALFLELYWSGQLWNHALA